LAAESPKYSDHICSVFGKDIMADDVVMVRVCERKHMVKQAKEIDSGASLFFS
jgi:hypothetical protein